MAMIRLGHRRVKSFAMCAKSLARRILIGGKVRDAMVRRSQTIIIMHIGDTHDFLLMRILAVVFDANSDHEDSLTIFH